ncbi:MAG: hypothetical protein ACOVNY_04055 [Chitinophagaceae bacterium]
MDEQKIEFRKVRDFGQVLSDTFQFIKQELKPLLTTFLAIGGFFILTSGIMGGIYQDNTFSSIFKELQTKSAENSFINKNPFDDFLSPTYFLLLFLSILSWLVTRVVLAVYVKLYVENNNLSPTVDAVWSKTFRYLIPIFFYSIVLLILVSIGTLFCLLPGIWLMVVFAPINLIFIVEDASLSSGINRCFYIIKDNFWNSFGVYIIAYLIYVVSSSVISLIIGSIAGLASYFTTGDVSKTVGIVTGVLDIFSQVMYIIFFVAIALQYYSLVEIKDGNGLLSRLQTVGNSNTSNSETEEQY